MSWKTKKENYLIKSQRLPHTYEAAGSCEQPMNSYLGKLVKANDTKVTVTRRACNIRPNSAFLSYVYKDPSPVNIMSNNIAKGLSFSLRGYSKNTLTRWGGWVGGPQNVNFSQH